MKHPQLRRARKVGEAVFRGANSVHTFEVFPLTIDIRDSAAVFIISRRITDRSKTGHHRAVCVGEAESIVGEIKRHRRAKCVKIHEANAICILRENDRTARSQVIDDLVAARSFDCIRNVSKPVSKPTSSKLNPAPNAIKRPLSFQARGKPAAEGKNKTSASKVGSRAKVSKSHSAKRTVKIKDPAHVEKAANGRSSAESERGVRQVSNARKRVRPKVTVKAAGKSRSKGKLAA